MQIFANGKRHFDFFMVLLYLIDKTPNGRRLAGIANDSRQI